VRVIEAGHILGSARLKPIVEEGRPEEVVLFSSDVGPHPKGIPAVLALEIGRTRPAGDSCERATADRENDQGKSDLGRRAHCG
jgi:hypothetical protein